MSTVLDKLIARASGEMKKPSRDMRRAIATAHSAATYAAIKERTGVMPKGLSRAERNDLKARVAEQLKYYDRFAAQAGDMSDAAVAARAGMYAGAVRGTYYGARYPGLSQYPGDGGTQCLTNCKCSLDERDDGIYWILNPAEHCDGCQTMAANSPYNSETKAIKAQTAEDRAMFAKMGGGKGPGKGYDKSKSTLEVDKAKGGGGAAASNSQKAKSTVKDAKAGKIFGDTLGEDEGAGTYEARTAFARATHESNGNAETVPIKKLVAETSDFDADRVASFMDQSIRKEDAPTVMRYDGKDYLMDGHHRVLSRAALGDSNVAVRVYDVSDAKPKGTGVLIPNRRGKK